jgi:hypothetical protein
MSGQVMLEFAKYSQASSAALMITSLKENLELFQAENADAWGLHGY